MKRIWIILLLIVACQPTIDRAAIDTPTGPTPRQEEVIKIQEIVENDSASNYTTIEVNDEGTENLTLDWRNKNGVQILVSDGSIGARTFITEGQTIVFPLAIKMNISLLVVDENKVYMSINGEERFIDQETTLQLYNNSITIHIGDTIVR